MTRHGNVFIFTQTEEIAFDFGVKRCKISASTAGVSSDVFGALGADGALTYPSLVNPNCYGYPMSLGETTGTAETYTVTVIIEEYGTGNPHYWDDIERRYPTTGGDA